MKDNNSKNNTGDNSTKQQNGNNKSKESNPEIRFGTREYLNDAKKDTLSKESISGNFKKLR